MIDRKMFMPAQSFFAVAFILSVMSVPATAQEWPARPVRIVVPCAAGATPDIIMRLIGERLHNFSEKRARDVGVSRRVITG